jgi:hypothetical protein
MKKCKLCNLEQEDSNFYKNGKYLLSNCRKCLNKTRLAYQNEYRKKNSEKVAIWGKESRKRLQADEVKRAHKNELKRASFKRNIIHVLWKRTKDRALKKGYDFNLEESDITIPELCPILEIPIFCGDRSNYNNSPTIDRVDNSKGYTKDNIKIISMLANTMKNSASIDELKAFCKNILNYINDKDDIV